MLRMREARAKKTRIHSKSFLGNRMSPAHGRISGTSPDEKAALTEEEKEYWRESIRECGEPCNQSMTG